MSISAKEKKKGGGHHESQTLHDGSTSWWSISRMKAKLKHFKETDFENRKQLVKTQTTNDSLGEAVHVGKAGICMSQSPFTMGKVKWLKS